MNYIKDNNFLNFNLKMYLDSYFVLFSSRRNVALIIFTLSGLFRFITLKSFMKFESPNSKEKEGPRQYEQR